MSSRLWCITSVLVGILGWATLVAVQAQTPINYTFEDGKMHGSGSHMKVPPKIVTEGGNHFMRITGSTGDCQAIPANQCPPRNRSTVQVSSGTLLSNATMRQTYRVDLRFHQDGGSSVFELFQRAPGGESGGYGTLNANGPVFRFWRSAGTISAWSSYAHETKIDKVSWTVPSGQWHSYKLVAVWSSNPEVGRLDVYYDGQLKMTVKGRGVNLGPASNTAPLMKVGLYSKNATGVVDVDNIHLYPTGSDPGPTPGPGPGPAPEPGPGPTPPPVVLVPPVNFRIVRGS